VLVLLGANIEAKFVGGATALHLAAMNGHAEAASALVQLGAVSVRAANGDTPLATSVRFGHHQVAQVLRKLEHAARTQKAAATRERAQQAARQDTPETREAAERMAAALIEEEEREQAAGSQKKVRGARISSTFG
jgi:ankyrin repeat protein